MIQPPPPVLRLFQLRVLPKVPAAGRSLVFNAFGLAVSAHNGQTRDEGTPYIEHPVRVASILAETGWRDAEVLAAGLLHDTIEDCGLTEEGLARRFTTRVGALVKAVSKNYAHPNWRRVDFTRMPLEAKAIKLADRLDNLRSLHRSPYVWKRDAMREETYWRYLPVAREVGGPLGQLLLEWWAAFGTREWEDRETRG